MLLGMRSGRGAPGVPAAPVNSVAPVVSGPLYVGGTLTTTNGTWSGFPSPTYTYQWNVGGVDVGGATNSTYVLQSGDDTKNVYCKVTATNGSGSATANSNTVGPVGTLPVNTVAPSISGTPTEGQTLTIADGTWTGTAPITYAYQWKRAGSNISGATSSTYLLVTADVGTTITCTVTGTNGFDSASATATGVGPIAAASAFNPASLSPQLWYDPSDLSSMFTDTAGTTAVTTDGDLVARINDKSGNARHWLQSSSSKRPVYRTDGTLRWLEMDGIDDGFSVTLTVGDLTSTSAAVIAVSPGASETSWMAGHSALSTGTQFFGLVASGSTSSPNGGAVGSATYRVNGVTISPVQRGALYTAIPSSSVKVMTAETINLSAFGAFTAFDYPGFIYAGKCYGYIVPTALSSGDRSSLETWMGAKAGLTI